MAISLISKTQLNPNITDLIGQYGSGYFLSNSTTGIYISGLALYLSGNGYATIGAVGVQDYNTYTGNANAQFTGYTGASFKQLTGYSGYANAQLTGYSGYSNTQLTGLSGYFKNYMTAYSGAANTQLIFGYVDTGTFSSSTGNRLITLNFVNFPDTPKTGDNYFCMTNTPYSKFIDTRKVLVLKNCKAVSAVWNHYVGTTGNLSSLKGSGLFINTTTNTTGIITTNIGAASADNTYTYSSGFSSPIVINSGDSVTVNWVSPPYSALPTNTRNSVIVYCYY